MEASDPYRLWSLVGKAGRQEPSRGSSDEIAYQPIIAGLRLHLLQYAGKAVMGTEYMDTMAQGWNK